MIRRLGLIIILWVLASSAVAQIPSTIVLPQTFVNSYECDSSFTYELALPNTWITSAAPGWPAHLPYAATQAGLQQAITDMEAYRTAQNVGIKVDVPPSVYSGTGGIVIPQTSSSLSTSSHCLILASTQDANLPNGQTVCSHGVQDNLSTSTDIGIDNPACNGAGMYYQLGTTITTISAGAFTLANGTATNTSNYNDVQYMWTVQCTGVNCNPFTTCAPIVGSTYPCGSSTLAPDHWLIMDAEIRENAGNTGNSALFRTGGQLGSGYPETAESQLPTHYHARKIWAHGDWTDLINGRNQIANAFFLSCIYCSIMDSQASQNLRPGSEGHSVSFGLGGQLKIAHNWMEGSSIGSISGGTFTPQITNYESPYDLEVRRNRWTFPWAWIGVVTVPTANTVWHGNSLARKNAFEMKQAVRIVFVGNITENVDNSGAQGGPTGPDFTLRNGGGGVGGDQYAAAITDGYIAYNLSRNGCNGIQMDGHGSPPSAGVGNTMGAQRMFYRNNLWYNIFVSNPGCANAAQKVHGFSSTAPTWRGTITRNSAGTVATMVMTCTPLVTGNCPAGPVPFGYQQLQTYIGDPVSITGCTLDTTFNNGPSSVHTGSPAEGPLAITGTTPTGLTVVYPSVGPANSVDNSGNCTYQNTEGFTRNLFFVHNTTIDNNTIEISSNIPNQGPNYSQGSIFRDSIFTAGGWSGSSVGEGTPAEAFNWESASFTADHMIFATRIASKYTEWNNNPLWPSGPCSHVTGCNPPVSMAFPATPYCTGATPTSACIGFAGAMSMSSFPITLTDYHQYALRSDSVFASGQSQQASDGTDVGANITAIDSAQTATIFTCPYTCAATPFYDVPSYTLTGTIVGQGAIDDNILDIDCDSTNTPCSASYVGGTNVLLTAAPNFGYTFTGWSGACAGTGTCSLTMNSAQAVTATFTVISGLRMNSITGGTLSGGSVTPK